MSSLKPLEKIQLEDLFGMASGYVMEFTNSTFAEFFRDQVGIDIYDDKYSLYGNSKAKRLRAFWEREPDACVGKVLSGLLEHWDYWNSDPSQEERELMEQCRMIKDRLLGKQQGTGLSEEQFLSRDFDVSLSGAVKDASLLPILESRFEEAKKCFASDAPLAVIFLCGSILEGVLLSVACANPKEFNQAANSPKDRNGKVKKFHEWSLAQFIDVSCKLGRLKLDVKKFSHALRDFRNYIHPFEQRRSNFNPDKHTADICLQVLKAAIASLSGKRE